MIRAAHTTPGVQRARYMPEDRLCEVLCAAPMNGFVCRETGRLFPGVFYADRCELDFNIARRPVQSGVR